VNIAFGHSNMDFDCLGSLILVKKLFPGYQLVRSIRIAPAAHRLYTLYEKYFDCVYPKDISGSRIDNIIIVDTSSASRIKEFLACIKNSDPAIVIYDHHPAGNCDILGARLEGKNRGANTTCLAKLAMEKGLSLESEEATIALTGIYADTGSLIYENVHREDLEVSAWLLDQGASLRLVKGFLDPIKEDDQILVLNQLLLVIQTVQIQGNEILLSYLELDDHIQGLAAVVEKIMSIENPDAYFALFYIRKTKSILVIGRSQKHRINLHELFAKYGGGGHQSAGSASFTGREGPGFNQEFRSYLEQALTPATCVRDIMTKNVCTLAETDRLLDASKYMEEVDHGGLPVLNRNGEVSGFITLRDIMKGRRASQMNAPVSAYMARGVVCAVPGMTMREVERIFYKHHIGHIPVVEEGRLAGIVTRWDFLEYKKRRQDFESSPAEKREA
jgi:tRNA nucleotidyltransferase (CCA-adding enzyme)